jgi:hypothetical protein
MLGSDLLDIAIGLIFLYLLLSLICSALSEMVEAFLKKRSSDLEQGLKELLRDEKGEGLVKEIYDHPLVNGLFKGKYESANRKNLPSYIPSSNFALALMDIILPGEEDKLSGAAGATVASVSASTHNPIEHLRNAISGEKFKNVGRALTALVDAASNDVPKVRENIEAWYNNSMERVSGWYKRRAQTIIFCLGFMVAIAINADTIGISANLSRDKAVRDSLVATAQEYAKQLSPTGKPEEKIKENIQEIKSLGLPLGWSRANPLSWPVTTERWILKIIGWLITAVAISLGAPFWFDLLNKFMAVRSSIRPKERSPDGEASKENLKT